MARTAWRCVRYGHLAARPVHVFVPHALGDAIGADGDAVGTVSDAVGAVSDAIGSLGDAVEGSSNIRRLLRALMNYIIRARSQICNGR